MLPLYPEARLALRQDCILRPELFAGGNLFGAIDTLLHRRCLFTKSPAPGTTESNFCRQMHLTQTLRNDIYGQATGDPLKRLDARECLSPALR